MRTVCLLAFGLAMSLGSLPGHADTFYLLSYGGVIKKFTDVASQSSFADNNLNQPEGMAFDRAGNLYVANSGNDTIEMFAADGTASLFASAGLSKPNALACDSAGNLYVTNVGDGTITKFSPKGEGATFATVSVTNMNRMVVDRGDNLFVTTATEGIVKFTPGGVRSIFASPHGAISLSPGPLGLAFDADGNLYTSCGTQILRFTPAGVGSVFATVPQNGPARCVPGPMAFDSKGNLYVVDVLNSAIVKILPDGSGSLFAQSRFSPADISIRPDPPAASGSTGP